MRATLSMLTLLALTATLGACQNKSAPQAAVPAAATVATAPKQAAAPAAAAAKPSSGPATIEGAKALLTQWLKPGADHVALSKTLQPRSADYGAVFADPASAQRAETAYKGLWTQIERMPIKPKAGQTEVLVWKATTDDLKAGTGDARQFPGGYRRAAHSLKAGLTVFRWKFVEPGKDLGMAFDGLYNLDGRWVLMPKPWRMAR